MRKPEVERTLASRGALRLAAGREIALAPAVAERLRGDDVLVVELDAVASKYIGETEKNLTKLFEAAADAGVSLLFDEADALFGKRSEVRDAHDRYANLEVAYLVQLAEAHGGVAVLSTNKRANLDDAFLRRLRIIVDFPLPTAARRHKRERTGPKMDRG